MLRPVHAELSRHDQPDRKAVQHRQGLAVHQVGHHRLVQGRICQIERLHDHVGPLALGPGPAVEPLELQLHRPGPDPGGREQLLQPDARPERVPHRPVTPLSTGDSWLESTPAVPGALIHGGDRDRPEGLYQVVECDLERPLDVALDAEPPRTQVDRIRNELEVIPHVERSIRGKRAEKVRPGRLQLDSPIGHAQEGQLLRIRDEGVDAVPVRIGARAREPGQGGDAR